MSSDPTGSGPGPAGADGSGWASPDPAGPSYGTAPVGPPPFAGPPIVPSPYGPSFAPPVPRRAVRRGWRVHLRSEAVFVLGLLLAGVLLAVVWRLLNPYTVKLGDDNETQAAVDSTLALLGVVAALGTAAFVLLRPGLLPASRVAAAIIGSCLGAVISWQVGDLVGSPNLGAKAAVVIWPLATAILLFLGALLPGTSRRLELPEDRAAQF